MRGRSRAGAIGIVVALLLSACATEPPPPINSAAFYKRPPFPGEPGYYETIKYIADGLNYTAPRSAFFVSAHGEMCFLGPVNQTMNRLANYYDYWCMNPMSVATVDALENDVSYVNQVRLWCRHNSPQCAHKVGYPNMLDEDWIANSITAQIVPFKEEQAAIEHLIYLMGGSVRESEALR